MNRIRAILPILLAILLAGTVAFAQGILIEGDTWTTTYKLKVGSSGTGLAQVRIYSQSLTPAATAAAIGTTQQTFTVTGLATTDTVAVVTGPAPTSLCPNVSARVSAADTLQLSFSTLTAAACTPAAGTYVVFAIR